MEKALEQDIMGFVSTLLFSNCSTMSLNTFRWQTLNKIAHTKSLVYNRHLLRYITQLLPLDDHMIIYKPSESKIF